MYAPSPRRYLGVIEVKEFDGIAADHLEHLALRDPLKTFFEDPP
jgi:hypothetical protein